MTEPSIESCTSPPRDKHSNPPSRKLETSGRTQKLQPVFSTLAFKLALFTFVLIALTIYLVTTVVTEIMDRELLQSLHQRGVSITGTVSGPAGYSILSDDRLALDNLVVRIQETQPEMAYMAILDHRGQILAHNQLEMTGERFPQPGGTLVHQDEGLTISEVERDGVTCFEFRRSIVFANQFVGEVIIGLDTQRLGANRLLAHQKIVLFALMVLVFGVLASILLARFVSKPIASLSRAMTRVKTGEDDVSVPVTSKNEIGSLIRDFNDMARVIRVQRHNLFHYAKDLEESYNAIVHTLAGALDARDNYTYGHSARVATLAAGVARALDLPLEEIKQLEMACLLHDIGKIRVPDHVLNKQGTLDDKEYGYILEHPVHGAQILELASSLHKYIPAVLHHHEWFDGSGYPGNLRGDDIPLHAQIVAIADAYDAMTTSRPYRPGRSRHEAIDEIRAYKGRQFAPALAEIFIESLAQYTEDRDPTLMENVACG